VTNLDFIELLLEKGADPTSKDQLGMIPLISTVPETPGAAEFLLNWPTTDANITSSTGASFPAIACLVIAAYTEQMTPPDNPDQVVDQFLLQQCCESEEMLEKGRP
jgi:hypothetical protein